MEENRNVNNVPAEGNEDSINFSIHDLIQMVIGNWFWFLFAVVQLTETKVFRSFLTLSSNICQLLQM